MYKNVRNFILIIITSTIIFILKTSQFPGGEAGMAPIFIILTNIFGFIISVLVTYIFRKKIEYKYDWNILIHVGICFSILIFGFKINPFSSELQAPHIELAFWNYIAILISAFSVFIIQKVIK
ncbi:hypothetical protein [Epilithonimonas sp.]|uniref:hypothetical protein n=1 Tax=Epilithonimonas sp. TaxID=2894511 RepID=UPI0028A940F6|nr:hypothetical protein [Epilithonimonas sp.]